MSKQRSLRKKAAAFEDYEEEPGSLAAPPASVKAAQALRDKAKRVDSKKSLLSFQEDEEHHEGPAPKKKETRPKVGLKPPAAAAASTLQPGYTQVSAAGEYSADRIKELQRNTLQRPGGGGDAAAAAPAAPAFKLSGSFKPAAARQDERGGAEAAAAAPRAARPAAAPAAREPQPPARPAGVAPRAVADQADDGGGESDGDIPDEQLIKWAKAKRERLRGAHLAPDYIPISSMPAKLGTKLRGIQAREEGTLAAAAAAEDGEGSSGEEAEPEGQLRMVFGPGAGRGGPSAAALEQGGLGGAAGEEGAAEDEEDWAREQIRKGMGGLLQEQGPRGAGAAAALAEPGAAPPPPPRGSAAGSQAAAIAAAAEAALGALRAGVRRLRSGAELAERHLGKTGGSLEISLSSITRIEADLAAAGERYSFVQRMRAYVADLCAMLAEKSPLVETLEEELRHLQAERTAAHAARADAADADAGVPAEAAASAALGALSRGAAAAAVAAAAERAAQAAEARLLGGDASPELDEFGRDVNSQRRQQAAARLDRHRVWLAEAAATLAAAAAAGDGGEPPLGEETSSESEGEASHFELRRDEVREAAAAVFRDASDEFGTVAGVKRVLEDWKERHPAAYRDAYVCDSAPALFAPFVRAALLSWQPLAPGTEGIDTHEWYRLLFDYGMPSDPSAIDPADPDADLLPRLVRGLVLPAAAATLRAAWNARSARSAPAAARLLGDLAVYLPADDPGMLEVLSVVERRLEAAADSATLPPWPPAALTASGRARAHLARRFGRALRVLRVLSAFEGVLSRAMLQRLALERVVESSALGYVRAAAGSTPLAVSRAARLAEALPAEWFKAGAPRSLAGLMDLMRSLARSLAAQATAGGAAQGRDSAQRLVGALQRLGDNVQARALATAYGLELS